MQAITRNIVASVMLHSALLAAVFAIGGSSMQQTRRLMIVSLFDELQPGEPSSPHPGPAAAPARKKTVVPASIPAQDRPRLHTSPAKNQEVTPAIPVRGETAPVLQTPAASPAKMIEPSGVSAGAKGGSQGAAGVRAGTGNPAMQAEKSGPETAGSGVGSTGREQQSGDMDPALRRKIRDTLQSNLVYPYLARKKRIEGTVLAEFRLNSAGMPENMRIVKTSNYAILDEAAKETIQKAAPYPAQNRRVEIPITFRLRERE